MNYYNLADLISRINVAYRNNLISIKVLKNKLSLNFIYLIYKIGLIRGFYVLNNENYILVYLKYKNKRPSIHKIEIISKPSKRVY
jgi:ribosomal protein S8